ncbi:MAG: hypothetical protein JNM22_01040 [Saprospiraceae bacterium]|nr:hypothetical protein [Saprospiraceae bacterium]
MKQIIFLLLILPFHAFSQAAGAPNAENEYRFKYHSWLSIRDTLSGLPLLNLMNIEIELQGFTNGKITYMEGNILNEGLVSATSFADRYIFDLHHQTVFILLPDDHIKEVYRLRPVEFHPVEQIQIVDVNGMKCHQIKVSNSIVSLCDTLPQSINPGYWLTGYTGGLAQVDKSSGKNVSSTRLIKWEQTDVDLTKYEKLVSDYGKVPDNVPVISLFD